MTNEELAVRIQGGERERLPELWEQVERFVAMQAGKRARNLEGYGGVTDEDLYQSGYLALVAAVDSYDPGAGCTFIGWLALALRTAFAEAAGYRTSKRDALERSASLDAPAGDEDGAALGDLQADPAAAQAMQAVEDDIWREQLHDALEKAMARLPARQGDTLRRRFYQNRSLDRIAADENVNKETVRQWQMKGLRALRRKKELAQFVESRTPYYARWSAQCGERTTEMVALRREDLVEWWAKVDG